MKATDLYQLLSAHPFPGTAFHTYETEVKIDLDGWALIYREPQQWLWDGRVLECRLPADGKISGAALHAEIRHALEHAMGMTVSASASEAEARGEDVEEYLIGRCAAKMAYGLELAARATKAEAQLADLERDLASKSESLTTANSALNRMRERLRDKSAHPDDVVKSAISLIDAAREMLDWGHGIEALNAELTESRQALAEISRALDDAGAPATYSGGGGEPKPIPAAERVRLLGERARAERAERIRESGLADLYRKRLSDANLALDDAGAPILADGAALLPAARIRALSC